MIHRSFCDACLLQCVENCTEAETPQSIARERNGFSAAGVSIRTIVSGTASRRRCFQNEPYLCLGDVCAHVLPSHCYIDPYLIPSQSETIVKRLVDPRDVILSRRQLVASSSRKFDFEGRSILLPLLSNSYDSGLTFSST